MTTTQRLQPHRDDSFDRAFKEAITLLTSSFKRSLDDGAVRVWKDYLSQELTIEQFVEAVKNIILTKPLTENNFPTAQEIVAVAKGDRKTYIYDQWLLVREARRQSPGHSDYKDLISRFDIVTKRVVDVLGGIAALRDLDNAALEWARKDFVKIYQEYAPRKAELEYEAKRLEYEQKLQAEAQARFDEIERQRRQQRTFERTGNPELAPGVSPALALPSGESQPVEIPKEVVFDSMAELLGTMGDRSDELKRREQPRHSDPHVREQMQSETRATAKRWQQNAKSSNQSQS